MKKEDKIYPSGRTFHRDNCDQKVRKSHKNKFGDIVVLLGKHNFEYSVGIIKKNDTCMMTLTIFNSRDKALEHYNKLVKQY